MRAAQRLRGAAIRTAATEAPAPAPHSAPGSAAPPQPAARALLAFARIRPGHDCCAGRRRSASSWSGWRRARAAAVLTHQRLPLPSCSTSTSSLSSTALPSSPPASSLPPRLTCTTTSSSSSSSPLLLSPANASSFHTASRRDHMGHGHGHGGGHGHSHGGAALEDLPDEAGERAQRITWYGMYANAGLCVGKAGVGFYSGSASLVADAAHSISDMVSDVVALLAVRIGRRPADAKLPYGYGHYETLGTLSVAAMLVGAGAGAAVHGLEHLRPLMMGFPVEPVTAIPAAVTCAIVSVVVKEMLYQVTVKVGKEVRSQVLIANAWHHRTDAFSSIVALLGIGGAAAGVPYLDPLGAMLVAGMIMKTGFSIGWEAVHNLVDAQTNEHLLDEVRAIGHRLASEGHIIDLHNVRCRRLGHYVLVDLHVLVDEYLSVTAARHAADKVEYEIKQQLPEVAEVMMHLDAHIHREGGTVGIVANEKGANESKQVKVSGSVSGASGTDAETTEGPQEESLSGESRLEADVSAQDEGSKTSTSQKQSLKAPSARTQREIEADIRQVVNQVQAKENSIVDVTHISLHYKKVNVESSEVFILAEVSLILDPGLTIAVAKMNALMMRDEILSAVKDVGEVDVHMELLHGVLDADTIHTHHNRPNYNTWQI